jgi:hypothetical protein
VRTRWSSPQQGRLRAVSQRPPRIPGPRCSPPPAGLRRGGQGRRPDRSLPSRAAQAAPRSRGSRRRGGGRILGEVGLAPEVLLSSESQKLPARLTRLTACATWSRSRLSASSSIARITCRSVQNARTNVRFALTSFSFVSRSGEWSISESRGE